MERDKDEPVVNREVCRYQSEQLHELSLKYRNDKNYRGKVGNNSGELPKSSGVMLPQGMDARFVANTDKTWYLVMARGPKRKTRADRPGAPAGVNGIDPFNDPFNAASLAVAPASFRGRAR